MAGKWFHQKGKTDFFSVNHKDVLLLDFTTVHHILIFLPPPVHLNPPGHFTRMLGQFSFTNCYSKSHLDICLAFQKQGAPPHYI